MGGRLGMAFVGFIVVVVVSACSSSVAKTATYNARCCRDSTLDPNTLVDLLRPECPSDRGNVRLVLTETHIAITFPCRSVRHDRTAVRVHAVAVVAKRNDAAARAAKVVAYERRLGVYGDLVDGRPEYPDDLDSTTFSLGAAVGHTFICRRASDLKFRAQELHDATTSDHETPVHWLKIEAARVAGLCPAKLAAFYDTVQRLGAGDAVTVVRPLLAQTSGCDTDSSEIRTAVAAYQAANNATDQPTMARLVAGGFLQQSSTLYTVSYVSGVLTLTGTGNCTGVAG